MLSSSLPSSNQLSVVVLAVLSHKGLLSESQCGWINEVCHNQLFDNIVQLQDRFKTFPSCESYAVKLQYRLHFIENLCMICQESQDYVEFVEEKYREGLLCYLAVLKNKL